MTLSIDEETVVKPLLLIIDVYDSTKKPPKSIILPIASPTNDAISQLNLKLDYSINNYHVDLLYSTIG